MNRALLGDCILMLRTMDDDTFDSLVTDPPAGIGFMGKEWDHHKGGRDQWVAWMAEVMRECHRVLKPGAHGLVWALPRTSHWTATALEDAGFEVRDIITHLFGSGFPKSLDVSKAIDKAAGAERKKVARVRVDGKKPGKVITGFGSGDPAVSSLPATDAAKQWQGFGTALKPASEHWILVRKKPECATKHACEDLALCAVPSTQLTMHGLKEAEDLLARTVADSSEPQELQEKILLLGRAVNGSDTTAISQLAQSVASIDLSTVSSWKNISDDDLSRVKTFITSTATKPITVSKISSYSASANTHESTTSDQKDLGSVASEHFILVRKPCSEKTVAANVLKWGTGALNIDASRIDTSDKLSGSGKAPLSHGGQNHRPYHDDPEHGGYTPNTQGRFPANLVFSHTPYCTDDICDLECAIKMLDEQSGDRPVSGTAKAGKLNKSGKGIFGSCETGYQSTMPNDSGGASRFFYCAKISRAERHAGVGMEGEAKRMSDARPDSPDMTGKFPDHDGREKVGNHHPTVKPKKLMTYLIRMVTPPGGAVLDPFMGSGSTGLAAVSEGYGFTGIEREPDYFEIASKRIQHAEVPR